MAREEIHDGSRLREWPDVRRAAKRRRRRDNAVIAVAVVAVLTIGGGAAIASVPRYERGQIVAAPAAAPAAAGFCERYPVDEKSGFLVVPATGTCDGKNSYLYGRTVDGGRSWKF